MDQATVQTIALVFISMICTGMVPWAIFVERRLARIEVRLSEGISDKLGEHEERINSHAKRIQKLEIHAAVNHKDTPE